MHAFERNEFYYENARAIRWGSIILSIGILIGTFPILASLVHFLRFGTLGVTVEIGTFSGGAENPVLVTGFLALILTLVPFALFGLIPILIGLYVLSRGFDRRPVVVVDSEGLFYRPHGPSIIPWRDIRGVEWLKDINEEAEHCILVTRHGARPFHVYTWWLPGDNRKSPVYTAITRAWKRHRDTA